MHRLFLVVERAVPHGLRRIVTLFPALTPNVLPEPHPCSIVLKLPNGASQTASIGYSDCGSGSHSFECCFLEGIDLDEIPAGTELWYQVA